MTINIPLKAFAFVAYTLALLGGAFGISYAVFEWRGDGEEASAYVNCANDALQTDIDESERLRRERPEAPDSPAVGAPQAAFDAYSQRFIQYEKEYDGWLERVEAVVRDYDEDVRACGDILD